jgi:ABC-type phosphate transport system substrate-binding protein
MSRLSLLLAWLLLGASAVGQSAWAYERPFVVITGPGEDRHLSREAVSQVFLRKQAYWDDGTRIQPVNLPADHAVRRAFSQVVLGHLPQELEDYWREMYFHGVVPPHVLASEEAVILFVASTPGAIGYVSTCYPDSRVSVVMAVGEVPHCPR